METAGGLPPSHRAIRSDIQGLRAIAVISVVIYHAGHGLLPGGFIGVDVFFVISGFLIGGILMNELDRGGYSLAAFYRRRIRRLFPALYAMLAVVLAGGMILLPPRALKELGQTAVATVFFVSNFDFLKLSGYFAGESRLKPLLHTWSLAVEEQFYIVFPLFLALIWGRWRRHLRLILFLVASMSLAVSVWALGRHPSADFYLAPPRMFELLIGALVARSALPASVSQIQRDVVSLIGLGLLLVGLVAFDDSTPFPGLAALLPCCATALLLLAGTGKVSLAGRIIGGSRIVTYLGDISYSLYLWHWPLLVFGRYYVSAPLAPVQAGALVLVSIAAASLSWHFIERPFLTWRGNPSKVFGLGAAMMAAGSAAAGILALSPGLPSRFSPETLRLFASAEDYNQSRAQCHSSEVREVPYDRNCVFGDTQVPPAAVVWGDSHGIELVQVLGERLAPYGRSIIQITSSACPPALDYQPHDRPLCKAHNRLVFDRITHDRHIDTVVLTADFIRNSRADWPALSSGFARVVEGLRAAGKTVIIVYQIPIQPFDPPIGLGLSNALGRPLHDYGIGSAVYDEETRHVTEFLDGLSNRTGAIAFRPQRVLCDRAVCHAYSESLGGLYYNDEHVNLTGARLLVQSFPFDDLVGATAPPQPQAAEASRPSR
ncbi:MAG: acyltransferase family protein [Steroidobacteraceae bacterium]|jgi:peptidoglycan/LPS O-acetylase OafA/YrhL